MRKRLTCLQGCINAQQVVRAAKAAFTVCGWKLVVCRGRKASIVDREHPCDVGGKAMLCSTRSRCNVTSHAEKVVEMTVHSMLQELCCVCVLIFRQC